MARRPFETTVDGCSLPPVDLSFVDSLVFELPELAAIDLPLPPPRPVIWDVPPPQTFDIPCVPFDVSDSQSSVPPKLNASVDQVVASDPPYEQEPEGLQMSLGLSVDECTVAFNLGETTFNIVPTAFELDFSELVYTEPDEFGEVEVASGSIFLRNGSTVCGKENIWIGDLELVPPTGTSCFDVWLQVDKNEPRNKSKMELKTATCTSLKDAGVFRNWADVMNEDFVRVGLYRVRKSTAGLWTKAADFRMSPRACAPDPPLWSGKTSTDSEGNNKRHFIWLGRSGTTVMQYGPGGRAFRCAESGWKEVTGWDNILAKLDISGNPGNVVITQVAAHASDKVVGAQVGKITAGVYDQWQHGVIQIRSLHDGFMQGDNANEGNIGLLALPDITPAPTKGSLDTKAGDHLRMLQLREFDNPTGHALTYATDVSFTTDQAKRKMLLRVEDNEGKPSLEYASFQPLPPGDDENTSLIWDDTKKGWKPAPPVAAASRTRRIFDPVFTHTEGAGTFTVSAGGYLNNVAWAAVSADTTPRTVGTNTIHVWLEVNILNGTESIKSGTAWPSFPTVAEVATGDADMVIPLYTIKQDYDTVEGSPVYGQMYMDVDYRGAPTVMAYG